MEKVKTSKAPEAVGPYTQAIVSNGFLFISGQIPIDPHTGKIETFTIEGQAGQTFRNIRAICEKAGTSIEKTVKTTCFLADMRDFSKFNDVYATYFPGLPARSCVAVKTLPPQALCEVDAIVEL